MVQIVLNLVTDACEALGGRGDGFVRIATAYRPGLSIDKDDGRGRIALPIELSVSDNGPGVPADIRGDLFDPFVTTKREGRGLGLRSEEHTSELQSLMRTSYAVFCMKKKHQHKEQDP